MACVTVCSREILLEQPPRHDAQHFVRPVRFSWLSATIVLHDTEGKEALEMLGWFLRKYPQLNSNELIFRSRRNTPLLETNVLHDGLHPALRALGLPQAGMHAFRHGCNRRWELSG